MPSSMAIAAVAKSHQVASYVEIVNPWNGPTFYLKLTSPITGSVTIDRAQAVRRTCRIEVSGIDPALGSLIPVKNTDGLSPFAGHEMRVWRGIVYPNGTSEYSQLGVFRIATSTIGDAPDGLTLSIDGYDRARTISRAKLQDTYALTAGLTTDDQIRRLFNFAITGSETPNPWPFVYVMTTALSTIPSGQSYAPGDDPWAKAQTLAVNGLSAPVVGGAPQGGTASVALELYFDAAGNCQLAPVLDPSSIVSSWTFAEGTTCTMSALERVLSDDQVPNVVIRDGAGSGTTTPVRGQAVDSNAASPTYYLGPYSTVVDYASDSSITTQAQAQAAAQARLNLARGAMEQVTIDAVPIPWLDVGNNITVTRARSGVSAGLYSIDHIEMPLGTDLMQITARRVA